MLLEEDTFGVMKRDRYIQSMIVVIKSKCFVFMIMITKNSTFRQVSTLYIIAIGVYSSREDVISESMCHNNTVQTNAKEFMTISRNTFCK